MIDLSPFVLRFLISTLLNPTAPTAYIDPSTGGMLAQVLAVALAAFSGILFFFSRQIKTGLARLRRKLRHEESDSDPQQ